MTGTLSRSGARIRGDDYQHLVAWIQVLRAILGNSEIVALGIEDPTAGNADDVTLYKENGEREFFQTKSAVDARNRISVEWLMKPSRSGGPSVIQGFYQIWIDVSSRCKPKLKLVTNLLPADGDQILCLRDGIDGTVSRKLRNASPQSKAGKDLKRLACHLQVTEEEVLTFLEDVSFILGRLYDEWKEEARNRMYIAGLRYDEEAVRQGIDIVRKWVTEGQRKLTIDKLHRVVKPFKRHVESPAASLLIQAIDHDPFPDSATVVLDWTDHFPGEQPEARVLPLDPALWNDHFRPDLKNAARSLRALGQTNILVRGKMRLPTWFAAGVELRKTAGFQVTSFQGEEPWSSEGTLAEYLVRSNDMELSESKDLAVGIALAYDLSTEVLEFVRHTLWNVGRFVCIQPEKGASNQAIGSPAEARRWAFSTRDTVRKLVQDSGHSKIHLFLAGPSGAMLLLGHLWDRMPPTHLYEYLGPAKGYCPSFLIPN